MTTYFLKISQNLSGLTWKLKTHLLFVVIAILDEVLLQGEVIVATGGQLLASHLVQGALDHVHQLLFLLLLAAQCIKVLRLAATKTEITKYIVIYVYYFAYHRLSLLDWMPLDVLLPLDIMLPLATGEPPFTCSIIFICFSWQSLTAPSSSWRRLRSQSTVRLSTVNVLDCNLPGISWMSVSSNWKSSGVVGEVLEI